MLRNMSNTSHATAKAEQPKQTAERADRALFENLAERGEPMLVGIDTGRKLVFPDPNGRPSLRAWNQWKNEGYFPSVKIGKRVFVDPAQVRLALESRFTINAQ